MSDHDGIIPNELGKGFQRFDWRGCLRYLGLGNACQTCDEARHSMLRTHKGIKSLPILPRTDPDLESRDLNDLVMIRRQSGCFEIEDNELHALL